MDSKVVNKWEDIKIQTIKQNFLIYKFKCPPFLADLGVHALSPLLLGSFVNFVQNFGKN